MFGPPDEREIEAEMYERDQRTINHLRARLAEVEAERDRLRDEAAPVRVCHWDRDDDEFYETSCKGAFQINEGTPTENRMRFCCYCGAEIVDESVKAHQDEEEE